MIIIRISIVFLYHQDGTRYIETRGKRAARIEQLDVVQQVYVLSYVRRMVGFGNDSVSVHSASRNGHAITAEKSRDTRKGW